MSHPRPDGALAARRRLVFPAPIAAPPPLATRPFKAFRGALWRATAVALGSLLFVIAVDAGAADPGRGHQLYDRYCAPCHNPGTTPGPASLKKGANNPGDIAFALSNVVEMLSFAGLVGAQDQIDIAAWLGASIGVSAAPVAAIEFHHAAFDHYFVTAAADEIGKLDRGEFAGWSRTGGQFAVYATAVGNGAPVCRFFSTAFAPRSSHFYTALDDECARVKEDGDWQFEGLVFDALSPAADGTCAADTRPVYRLYNGGQGGAPNHRFTTDASIRAAMVASGWIAEGAGIGVAFCSPVLP